VVIINHFLPTKKRKETSEGVADRSTDGADMFAGSLAERSNRRTGKGPSGAQTAQ